MGEPPLSNDEMEDQEQKYKNGEEKERKIKKNDYLTSKCNINSNEEEENQSNKQPNSNNKATKVVKMRE